MTETQTLFDHAKEFVTHSVAAQRAANKLCHRQDSETSGESQCDRILAYLKKNGNNLTALKALRLFDCLNLKGRIWDLKNIPRYHHPNIQKRWLRVDSGKRVAQYFMGD